MGDDEAFTSAVLGSFATVGVLVTLAAAPFGGGAATQPGSTPSSTPKRAPNMQSSLPRARRACEREQAILTMIAERPQLTQRVSRGAAASTTDSEPAH
jgi:hypothetical protein